MKRNPITRSVAKGLYLFFITTLVAGLSIGIGPTQKAHAVTLSPVSDQSSEAKRTITAQALIDGRSQLILKGNTAQWLNLDFAAPGRWAGKNDPTFINGNEWFPTWPDLPNAENYSCNCYSDTFKGITPAFPQVDMIVDLKVMKGRGGVSIVQMPTASNDHTLIVEFDDDPYDGPATYQIELDISFRINRTIKVQALIDGKSQLILKGNTAQWFHLDFAAPGQLEGRNDPTFINGKAWLPTWPDIPDAENRFCNCYSDIFKGMTPALPQTDMAVELKVVQGRGSTNIIQVPTANNKYTLIIEFDDDPYGGAAIYEIELPVGFGG